MNFCKHTAASNSYKIIIRNPYKKSLLERKVEDEW